MWKYIWLMSYTGTVVDLNSIKYTCRSETTQGANVIRGNTHKFSHYERRWIDGVNSRTVSVYSSIFQLYHGDNKLIFNKMMKMSTLFYTNALSWIFIVLAHWNNCPRVDISLHSNTFFWFRADQPLLFLLNDVWATNTNFSLWFDPTRYRTYDLPHSRWARLPLRHRCGSREDSQNVK
jgi:hypothetical protein